MVSFRIMVSEGLWGEKSCRKLVSSEAIIILALGLCEVR